MTVYLESLCGGLGNQLFSVATVFALAKKLNTTFMLNTDQHEICTATLTIPTYIHTIFNTFLEENNYSTIKPANEKKINITFQQFTDLPISISILEKILKNKGMIVVKGLPMKLSLFHDYLPEIRSILYKQKETLNIHLPKDSSITNVGIMFRTFSEEKHREWMVLESYYKHAMNYLFTKLDCKDTIHIYVYTDEEGVTEKIIQPALQELGFTYPCIEKVGKRDNKTDVIHFFEMFDIDHFILCNSTYHYWPALISDKNKNKIVTYAKRTQDGNDVHWFQHIVEKEWVCLL